MRTETEKIELCVQFVRENTPRWLFNPDLLKGLRLQEIRFLPERAMRGNRGYAIEHKVRVSAVTAKWRSSSPYTSPCGKSDLSPLGVMAHEMGHILEFAAHDADVPYPHVWYDIHRTLHKQGVTSYARSHWREDIAESHRLFVLNPKLLNELSSHRHDAIRAMYHGVFGTRTPAKEFKLSVADFKAQFKRMVLT